MIFPIAFFKNPFYLHFFVSILSSNKLRTKRGQIKKLQEMTYNIQDAYTSAYALKMYAR